MRSSWGHKNATAGHGALHMYIHCTTNKIRVSTYRKVYISIVSFLGWSHGMMSCSGHHFATLPKMSFDAVFRSRTLVHIEVGLVKTFFSFECVYRGEQRKFQSWCVVN